MNRLVVLSDIHGFWESLAVVAAIAEVRAPDTQVLVAGDLVPGGAHPTRVLDWVMARAAEFTVLGNHDEKTLTRPAPPHDPFDEAAVAAQMTPAHWALLAGLPHALDLTWRGHCLRMLHGHRDLAGQAVGWTASAEAQRAAFHDPACAAVFAGHTHFPYALRVGESWMANPGSLGHNILRVRDREGRWLPRGGDGVAEHEAGAPTYNAYLVVTEEAGKLRLALRRFEWPREALVATWEAAGMAGRRVHWARTGVYDHLLP